MEKLYEKIGKDRIRVLVAKFYDILFKDSTIKICL